MGNITSLIQAIPLSWIQKITQLCVIVIIVSFMHELKQTQIQKG